MPGYSKKTVEFWRGIRNTKTSLNDWIEQPALIKLLPELKGKTVLDLGCGTGETTLLLAKRGAKVHAVEASKSMLNYCPKHDNIIYYNLKAEDIKFEKEFFDLTISELLLDNVKDIKTVLQKMYYSLKRDGQLLISIPHPFRYAFNKKSWDDVNITIGDYFKERVIRGDWEGNIVIHYHRTLETIINLLINTGFNIVRVSEPKPLNGFKKVNKKLYYFYSKIPFVILFKCIKS